MMMRIDKVEKVSSAECHETTAAMQISPITVSPNLFDITCLETCKTDEADNDAAAPMKERRGSREDKGGAWHKRGKNHRGVNNKIFRVEVLERMF
jgi:hypothetical protein